MGDKRIFFGRSGAKFVAPLWLEICKVALNTTYLLELLDGTLIDTTAFVDKMASRSGLA